MARQSLAELLGTFVANGDETAFVWKRGYRFQRWSYRHTAEMALLFARELERRGIGKGDRVVLWGENCGEWVAACFGTLRRGAVAVPLDKISAPDFAARVAQQVDAKLVVRGRDCAAIPGVPELILDTLEESLAWHRSDERAAGFAVPETQPGDPAQIIFTSGTTMEPKGVVITHRNVLVNLEPLEREILHYRKYGRIFHPLRFLCLLPLSHVFGQFLSLFIPQVIGATVIFSDTLHPGEVIRAVKRERVSVIITVPRLLETLRDKIERDLEAAGELAKFKRDFAAMAGKHFTARWWRFRAIHNLFGWKFWAFVSGGATLDRATEEFWGRLSFVVIQGYGLTETTSLISVNHPFRLGKGSIGKVLPGREIKLAPDGEILVRGENIAAGYWQGKELKPVEGEEGWFRTGDVGELDAAGNLYFKGRKKNVIVTAAGMKVYPEDLEAALRRQPEVRDCVVVGLEREGNAEACAVLILDEKAAASASGDGAALAADIVKRANASLAEFQQMRSWLVWPERDFPRTSTQKPRTNVITEFAAAQLSSDGAASGAGAVTQAAAGGATSAGDGAALTAGDAAVLRDLITRITGRKPDALSASANLASDLNLSSMDRVELLSALEDRYQVDLNETKFTAATTVADLEQMLREPETRRSEMVYPRWTLSPPQNFVRNAVQLFAIRPATAIFGWPRVRGRENLRGVRGPVIVICNHISQVDIGLVHWALPWRLRSRLAVAMEGEYLERLRRPAPEVSLPVRLWQRFEWFACIAWFNAFPMASRSGVRESFLYCGEAADRGYNLLIFPEGQRTKHGGMNAFRAGIGLIVKQLKLPVVTMRIDGLWEFRQAQKKWAPSGALRVTIGPVQRFDADAEPHHITRALENIVANLEWKVE